ncbi:MAG TPA: hypothetical protein VH308_03765 [Terracidiphilus sp.]|jgi:hypothetical protein|nr:hypothetical protein [Terracidiphilus sp.]
MMLRSCPREKEVKELVERGQWPVAAATAPELRAHVSGCRSCGELIIVTEAFQKARAASIAAARPGSPGLLWWRAQLRRRNAAVERIGRPIIGAQIFALAVNLVLAVGVIVWQANHGLSWLAWIKQLPQTAMLHFDSQWLSSLWASNSPGNGLDSLLSPIMLIPAAATLALVAGVVVYLTSEK